MALPPVIGNYVVVGDRVRFTPRFGFEDGVSYEMTVDLCALADFPDVDGESRAGSNRSSRLQHPIHQAVVVGRYHVPRITPPSTTRIVAVHPNAGRLPENTLRWYVEFSSPMQPGSAREHVHLVDEAGNEIVNAFLEQDEELWDPSRKRLTLLFDPGRIKRGLRANLQSGAPLVAGRRYRLVIDASWMDANGASLMSGYDLQFEAVRADRSSPEPARWRVRPPIAGSLDVLRVEFDGMLDHALASRLTVIDATGRPLAGTGVLLEGDSSWIFRPERSWKNAAYQLRIPPELEDLAGNGLSRLFDEDLRTRRVSASPKLTIEFRPVPGL